MGLKHPVLLAGRQAGVKRDYLGGRQPAFGQRVGRVANVAFAGQEDKMSPDLR